MLVAVCVATYKRPEGLKRLMVGLNQLTFIEIERPNIEVIIVDNDANNSAQAFCEQLQPYFKWQLKYCNEPQQGISYARNKAIASVSRHTDFLVFIDDDEVPESSWLEKLLSVQQAYDADVVAGPVLPYFPDRDVPSWAIKGRFFEPQRYPTGHLLKVAFTGNVLIRFQILKTMNKMFDERFALTGGEDTHFFMRLYRAGYKMVWADEAIAYEWVPKSRTNVQWILKRGYRCYISHGLCEKEFYPLIQVLPKRLITGTGRIVLGLLGFVPSLFLSRHLFIQALLQICRGAGMLSGLAGRRYEEYKNIHSV